MQSPCQVNHRNSSSVEKFIIFGQNINRHPAKIISVIENTFSAYFLCFFLDISFVTKKMIKKYQGTIIMFVFRKISCDKSKQTL